MKKIVRIAILMCFMMFLVGCNSETTMTMTTEGQGKYITKFAVGKNIFENEYAEVKSVDEFARIIKDKLADLEAEVYLDKKTSDEEDYISIAVPYKSIEDYNNKIRKILNNSVNPQDEEIMTESSEVGMNLYGATSEVEVMKYLTENNIHIDKDNRNGRKFLKVLGALFEGYEQVMPNSILKNVTKGENDIPDIHKEYYKDSYIEDCNGVKTLKLSMYGELCLFQYVQSAVMYACCKSFDTVKLSSEVSNNKVYADLFNEIDLAGKIRETLDNKYGDTIESYSINDMSPVMVVDMFSGEYEEKLRTTYLDKINKEKTFESDILCAAKECYDYQSVDMVNDIITIAFGGKSVSITLQDIYNNVVDSYLSISTSGDANIVMMGEENQVTPIEVCDTELGTVEENDRIINGEPVNVTNTVCAADSTNSNSAINVSNEIKPTLKPSAGDDKTPKTGDTVKSIYYVAFILAGITLTISGIVLYKKINRV